jgi:YjbE family integral membrane protein
MDFASGAFWSALGAIVLANIVLSGDNAIVIAMAARSLPPARQRQAIVGGTAAAIVMRIGLTLLAVELLRWPYLKLIGALLLLAVGVSLMHDDPAASPTRATPASLGAAIRTILVADMVMSLDNVIAVAAAARGSRTLLVLGLGLSIPLIAFGSTLLLRVMERWPLIVTFGAALLGWLAGEMVCTDPAVVGWFGALPPWVVNAAAVAGAGIVVGTGLWLQRRRRGRHR